MNRKEGYYWVFGYVWSETPSWFIAYWDNHSFWIDGDDISESSMIEIDETQITR